MRLIKAFQAMALARMIKMDEFDFEELISDMLDITDKQREDEGFVANKVYEEFGLDFEQAFNFCRRLIEHTPTVQTQFSGKNYHAFVSKKYPVMLMRLESDAK